MRQDFNKEQYDQDVKALLANSAFNKEDRMQVEMWLELFSIQPHYTVCLAEAYKFGVFMERVSRQYALLGRELDRLFWLTIQHHDNRYVYNSEGEIVGQ